MGFIETMKAETAKTIETANMKVETAEKVEELLRIGKIEEAKRVSEDWVEFSENSKDSDPTLLATAYHTLALVLVKLGSLQNALTIFKKAIELCPNVAEYHNNIANVYLNLGNLENALQHLHQSLRIHPHHAVSFNNLGRILYLQGRIEEALPYFEKALRINPEYWEAHYNLAHSLVKLNQFTRASSHYEMVIKLYPKHANAHYNLALIYMEEKKYLEATQHFTESLTQEPNNLEAYRQLGDAYLNLGKKEDAKATFLKALTLKPDCAEIQHNLAILHLRDKEQPEALERFKKAVDLNPKNETAKHMTEALQGSLKEGLKESSKESFEDSSEGNSKASSKVSSEAPKAYIKDLFDQYADYYNKHVKDSLNYQVPGLLRNAVGRIISPGYRIGRVLDIGCGTGLCAIYFRELAFELIGIDISSKMIAHAKSLQGYDSLIETDMIDYLSNEKLDPFLLIYAADVFVYTGDLSKVFDLVEKKLLPNGLFTFTTEWLEDAHISMSQSKGYFLQPTGRFAHTSDYIRDLTTQYHFKIELQERIIPREHEGSPIQGELFVLRKESR